MLVRLRERIDGDAGSTLVVVLIVMLVLTVGALTMAAIVTNTTVGLVSSRSTVQSRAAADAGLAAAVGQARRTGSFCAISLSSSTAPAYTVSSACANGQVTFTSIGAANGRTTTTKAVYAYATGSDLSGVAELVFFNSGSDSVYFTNHVMPQTNSNLATILFPGGGLFECKTTVPGNVITKGSIQGQSGCTITGSVYAGGLNPTSGYALYLNNNDQVLGGAAVVGNVLIAGGASSKIGGTLTVPSTATVTSGWGNTLKSPTSTSPYVNGGKAGGITWSTSLGQPSVPSWFEYSATNLSSDWAGYQIVTLTATSSPYNCTNWTGKFTTFWSSYINGLTQNTVIDARACKNGMDTAQGANSTASIGVNVVFIANHFTLGTLVLSPKPATTPSAWFIVPDTTNNGAPTCPAADKTNNWDYRIQTDAAINVTVSAMMYTPCDITVGAGGTWTGAMYAGSLNDGGDITIYTNKMALPGQWGSGAGGSGSASWGQTSTVLGTLVSQRDIP